MSETYSASNRTIHFWAIGGIADVMLYVGFAFLVMPIFSIGFGMDPRLVGLALTLPRITDALLDPLIGHFSDNLHTRWGRRRPFLLFAGLLGSVTLVAMWWPSTDWSQTAQFVWLLGCSIVLFFCYGMYTMTHQALGFELTDDHHLRAKVWAVRGMYMSIASGLIGGWLWWMTLRPCFGGEINGIRWISVGMAVLVIGPMLVTVLTCKERFANANRKHVNLWKALRSTLTVKPFAILLAGRIVGALGGVGSAMMGMYISIYYICEGDKSMSGSLSGYNGWVGFAVALLMVPLAIKLSKKIERRWGYIILAGVGMVNAILSPIIAQPGHPYAWLSFMIVMCIVGSVFGLYAQAVLPDICDLDELESGERREGMFTAVLAFQSKIENSLCVLISGYLVAWSGFDAQAAKDGIAPSPETLNNMLWVGFTPPIIFGILAFIIACYFPITKKMMDEVREKLVVRRAEAKAAAEAEAAGMAPR